MPLPRLCACLCSLLLALVAAANERITERELRGHVDALADPELQGRAPGTDGSRRAAQYVVERLESYGLEAAGEDETPFQTIRARGGAERGRNICFLLPASEASKGTIVVGAHYDHLGAGPEGVFAGADDNASGVAALIEIAEQFAARASRPRDVLFLAFDCEEQGMVGSSYWVAHPTVPLDRVDAMVNIDMLGRSVMDRFPGCVFAFGTEWSEDLGGHLRETKRPGGVEVWNIGTEYVGPRSDFLAFGLKRIPYVFFTTGTHEDYHTPGDVAAEVDVDSMAKLTRFVASFTERVADAEEPPRFHWMRPNALREAEVVHRLVSELTEDPPPGIPDWQIEIAAWLERRSARMIERGRVGLLDRVTLIATTQALTLTMLQRNRSRPDEEPEER